MLRQLMALEFLLQLAIFYLAYNQGTRMMQRSYGTRTMEVYNPQKHGQRARQQVRRAGCDVFMVPTVWNSLCTRNQKIYANEYVEFHLYP
jgi:hypothetical protein